MVQYYFLIPIYLPFSILVGYESLEEAVAWN